MYVFIARGILRFCTCAGDQGSYMGYMHIEIFELVRWLKSKNRCHIATAPLKNELQKGYSLQVKVSLCVQILNAALMCAVTQGLKLYYVNSLLCRKLK